MSNDFFNFTNPLTRYTLARESAINSVFQSIQSAFDLIPGVSMLNFGKTTYCVGTGTANTYAAAMPTTLTGGYADGLEVTVKIPVTNTGASTLNVDAQGAIAIKTAFGADPDADDLTAGDIVGFRYNADSNIFRMTTPHRGYVGNAESFATAAAASAGTASTAATTATTQAGIATTKASEASDSADAAAASAAQLPTNKFDATANPTVNDDSGEGYSPGSKWHNITSEEAFVCIDASEGAAVWATTTLEIEDLGTAAVQSVGTSSGNVPQLDGNGKIVSAVLALEINPQTGTTYTTVSGDAGKLVTLTNASAIALTIPPNSSVAYPVGTSIAFQQGGAGTVTMGPGAGVTLQNRNGLVSGGQYAMWSITKIDTDTWAVVGDLTS